MLSYWKFGLFCAHNCWPSCFRQKPITLLKALTCSFVKCTMRKLPRKFIFVHLYTRFLDSLTLCIYVWAYYVYSMCIVFVCSGIRKDGMVWYGHCGVHVLGTILFMAFVKYTISEPTVFTKVKAVCVCIILWLFSVSWSPVCLDHV